MYTVAMAMRFFYRYHNSNTKDEAIWRKSGNESGASDSVFAEMHLSMSKQTGM